MARNNDVADVLVIGAGPSGAAFTWSLSEAGIDWRARSVTERKLDAAVWHHRQLYVVAAANAGFQALGDVAGAKNSLAVGAAHDSGDIASFSSHGPTGDGRLVPQVSASLRSIGNLLSAPLDDYSPPTLCAHASVRPGRLAVGVMCARSAFSERLSDGTLRPEEKLNAGHVDRFERDVAEFDVSSSAAASPDGRHLYAELQRGPLILGRTPQP